MISKNCVYSFEDNLSFENLSTLLNNLSIITHPMTNEQKVCIEYPNINIENKNIDILSEEINNNNKTSNDEFILNLSKSKKYEINPKKLYDEFDNKIPYSLEEFKNSLKIFISIFNSFNEDIFKWNLSDFNLFNNQNLIQCIKFNKENKNNKLISVDYLNELYKKHFSVKFDLNKTEIIEISNKDSNEINNNIDDFEKDFADIDEINNNKNEIIKNNDLYSYEKDCVFRNIFFLMNLFNLINKFKISEYNIDNIFKNIDKFNSYIINDYKILLLIFFHIAIQINLYIKKAKVDNFLNIKQNETPENKNNSKEKIANNFYPNIFFYDYQDKEISKDENDLKAEKIILLNIILKLFNLSYLVKLDTNLKINIKIFAMSYFSEIKSKLIITENENYFIESKNIKYILELISNKQFVELFINDSQKCFTPVIFEFILSSDIDINSLNNKIVIYEPFIMNSELISFDTLENDSQKLYPLNNYLNEIVILSYALKLILKTVRTTKKSKFAFTFVFNSFSIALRKHKSNINDINMQDLMIYMGIYHYNENEMVQYISDEFNYYALYKKYKEILKCCGEYKNYNINIRLFKNGIINKELQYHFISLILNILNNIKIKNKTFYKNISLYESKFINTTKCIYIRIKKQNKEENLISKSSNNNINTENNLKEKAVFSPNKKRNNSILGKLNIFKKNKNNNITNSINIFKFNDNLDNNNHHQKKIKQKFNNFYKNLTNCSFLSKLESEVLINFFKSVKNYFTDFMFYIERINLQINKNKNKFIFENTFDSSISFDPINILRNFNNNKCFIILKEFSYIDLYIYLYDFYENNIEEENSEQKSKIEIYNDIFNNINILREKCYENFLNKNETNCSIVIGKLNFIVQKSFLILNQYFEGNKIFFRNDNKIIILDKYTNTDCILDNGHIDILLNNIKANDKNEINEENTLVKFYTTFLYEYDIIKYIIEKKFIKVNKLNIIIKRKILQINEGKIQLKKINLKNNNEKCKNIQNIHNSSYSKQDSDKSKPISNENYNLFKIRDLFKYKNSYPLIILFLQNETEISNFSFLLFSFAEIFIHKQYKELTKELLIKRINQFFYSFKNVKFIPIIFNKKYLNYFLYLFNALINRSPRKDSKEIKNVSNNINKQIFGNIILFPINLSNILNQNEYNIYFNEEIFKNLTKSLSIYNIENLVQINYDINQIGKMFKLRRIKDTLIQLEISSNKTIYEENNNIIIYKINFENLKLIIKRNLKKVKFIGIDKENRTFNVHIFDSEDTLKKFKLENSNTEENCIIF